MQSLPHPRLVVVLLVLAPLGATACDDDDRSLILFADAVEVVPERLALTVGDSATVLARYRPGSGPVRPGRITFTSNAPALATVRATSDSTAVVKGVALGTGSVTMVGPANGSAITMPVEVRARWSSGVPRYARLGYFDVRSDDVSLLCVAASPSAWGATTGRRAS
jgi:uncharacterized protein YjdB